MHASTTPEPAGVTIGVTGQQARWSVTPWGAIMPWGDADLSTLEWYVAADDRWHVPAHEPTVRQRRIDGTPVVETRVRVPDGDAVQRVWAVPNSDGTVVVEFENESPMPFAIALASAAVITERPVASVAIQGIDLPDDAIVMPVGHQATVRVAMGHPVARRSSSAVSAMSPFSFSPSSLASVPPMLAVVRGWTRVVEQASRLVLPDEQLVDAIVSARCDLLLEGPVDAADDPAGFLLDIAELVRCGDSAAPWLLEIVEPAERLARSARKGERGAAAAESNVVDAFDAARLVAIRAGDDRAAADVERLARRVVGDRSSSASGSDALSGAVAAGSSSAASFADLRRGASVGRFVRSIERRLADDGRLLVGGMPTTWLGNNFEVHGLPTSATSSVSYAVRWHGERPAVLWEQHGKPVTLTAPDLDPRWSSNSMSGEVLWSAPVVDRPKRAPLSLTALAQSHETGLDLDGGSFS
jgi:hypothetical protein